MAEPFDSPVVEIGMGDGRLVGNAVGSHGEAMILRGDFHAVPLAAIDRLIAAAMTELELEGFAAKGKSQERWPRIKEPF